jgi:hypothetical protein
MDKLCRQNEVDACIDEIAWFATRNKNLAEEVPEPATNADYRTWGEMMLSDIADLRACLILERTQSDARVANEKT